MQIQNVTTHGQTAAELSNERVGRITGSALGAILGLSKWNKRSDAMRAMVRSIHCAPSEFSGNVATEWGKQYEGVALAAYMSATNNTADPRTPIPAPFYAGDLEGMKIGASPDALESPTDYLIEVKCPYGKRNEYPQAARHLIEHPDYEAQMQWQMLCADKPMTVFVVWTPQAVDYVYVPRNEFWLLANIEKIKSFWDELQEILASPELYQPMLDERVTGYIIREDDAFLDAADEYATIDNQIKKLTERQDLIKKQLLDLAGKQKCKGGGVTVFSTERKGTVDYAKVPQLVGVDLEQYRKKASVSWTVKVSGGDA